MLLCGQGGRIRTDDLLIPSQTGTAKLPHALFWAWSRLAFFCVLLHRNPIKWLRRPDLNWRPFGYEPNELPGCSTAQEFTIPTLFFRQDENGNSLGNFGASASTTVT